MPRCWNQITSDSLIFQRIFDKKEYALNLWAFANQWQFQQKRFSQEKGVLRFQIDFGFFIY
jgi:hypothetical protein